MRILLCFVTYFSSDKQFTAHVRNTTNSHVNGECYDSTFHSHGYFCCMCFAPSNEERREPRQRSENGLGTYSGSRECSGNNLIHSVPLPLCPKARIKTIWTSGLYRSLGDLLHLLQGTRFSFPLGRSVVWNWELRTQQYKIKLECNNILGLQHIP